MRILRDRRLQTVRTEKQSGKFKIRTRSWIRHLRNDLAGPFAYRTWIVVLSTAMTAYFGVYAVIESRHDRQMNQAMFERNTFVALTASGDGAALVAAMKNFGPIQTMSIPRPPPIFPPWLWLGTEYPNLKPLEEWAVHRLAECTLGECGSRDFRIDLRRSDLTDAVLKYTDLSDANLRWAKLTGAVLTGTNLTGADLSRAVLHRADLSDVILNGAVLHMAKLSRADVSGADLIGARLRRADLTGADLTSANLNNAMLYLTNLTGADLTDANLTGAALRRTNLVGADLTSAKLTPSTITQLDSVYWDEKTIWPYGLTPPCPHNLSKMPCTQNWEKGDP